VAARPKCDSSGGDADDNDYEDTFHDSTLPRIADKFHDGIAGVDEQCHEAAVAFEYFFTCNLALISVLS